MKVSYNMVSDIYGYGTEKTSQPPTNPFVIPSQEEIANEKTATQTTVTNNFYDPFKAAKTGSVSLPEWMNTKTEPKRSDEEILKDMEALAKEHAKTGQFFQDNDPRFKELMDEYVSSVSPDRESILKNSTNEINERITSELAGMAGAEEDDAVKEEKRKSELLDYLMEAIDPKKGKRKEKSDTDIISSLMAVRGNNIATGSDNIIASRGDGYYTAVDVDRGGGKVTTLIYDNQGNKMPWFTMKGDMYSDVSVQNGVVTNAFFNDSDGQLVMIYSNGNDNKSGLRQIETRDEYTRRKELQAVYNAVYDFSIGRYNPHEEIKMSGTMLTHVNGIGDPTALIKEVYDSTYERLRNEMFSSGVA
jgi:hypothetical protein